MAFLLPANLVNNLEVPPPLRQAAQAFRDWLPDQVTVTLHANEASSSREDHLAPSRSRDSMSRPFLVVLLPALGIVFLDFVPGSTVRTLASRRRARSPLRRFAEETRDRLGHLSSEVRERLAAQGLDDSRVPVALAIAAPRLTRARVLAAGQADVDQFLLQEDLSAASIEAALERVLAHAQGDRCRLTASPTAADERRMRAAVNPRLVIEPVSRAEQGQLVFRSPEGVEDVIQVLDRKQERLAEHLGDGYRVLKGVAGSGKTLVLVFRARHLARHHPQWRILLTCFNRPLALSLARQLDDCPNVNVRTIDGLASDICRKIGIATAHLEDGKFDRQVEEVARASDAGRVPDRNRYDAVLIDEAQDLDTSRTRMAFGLLRHPWSDFVVALDSAQNLYRRQPGLPPPAEHRPGSTDTTEISGRGRTEVLRVNYRNTHQILKFADDFLRAGGVPEGGDEEDPATFIPPEAAERTGPAPDVRHFESPIHGYRAVCEAILRSRNEGVRFADMAILAGNWSALNDFKELANEKGVPVLELADLDVHGAQLSDGVRLSTLHRAKGLEFARVYIIGVDNIRGGPNTDDTLRRRLLYVGMTRATDLLKIAVSGRGSIVDALLEARAG